MSVKLRLKRLGRSNRAFFRLNAIESRAPRDGRVIEELGHYDPIERDQSKQFVANLDDRERRVGTTAMTRLHRPLRMRGRLARRGHRVLKQVRASLLEILEDRELELIYIAKRLKEALQLEAKYFLECVAPGKRPFNDGRAGLRVVKMLERADASLKHRRAVASYDRGVPSIPSAGGGSHQVADHGVGGRHLRHQVGQ